MPESKFKIFWNIIIGIMLLYTIFVMPFLLAFTDSERDVKIF